MRKFFESMGSVTRVTIESQALNSNMLGDTSMRFVEARKRAAECRRMRLDGIDPSRPDRRRVTRRNSKQRSQ
jgi:hypothetical protein